MLVIEATVTVYCDSLVDESAVDSREPGAVKKKSITKLLLKYPQMTDINF